MYDFEIVNKLRLGLHQRLNSKSASRSVVGTVDDGLALLSLVAELYESKSSEDAYKVLQISSGQLPSYEQVNELQTYSCIALDVDELFRRVLDTMVTARGYAGLALDIQVIEDENVFVLEQSHLLSLNSGIQQVTRMIARELASKEDYQFVVAMPDGSGFTDLTEHERNHLLQDDFISPEENLINNNSPVKNILLDNCRLLVPEVTKSKEFASRLRAIGAFSTNKTFFIGYDLIPILAPEYVAPVEIESFAHYLLATTESTGVVCISNQTRDEFRGYFKARETVKDYQGVVESLLLPAYLKIEESRISQAGEKFASLEGLDFFLCVGTIEPRKNQIKVLTAFNQLWSRGGNQRIVFVGRISSLIKSKFLQFAEEKLGCNVFHFQDISDSELAWLYKRATATIQISSYEGFGLPVVESIVHGVPVIVNSFGVQHELSIGKGGFALVDQSVECLADAIDRISRDASLTSQLIEETSGAHFMNSSDYAREIQKFINQKG